MSGVSDVVSDIMDTVNHQRETLRKEVAKYCGERGVAAS
jgi:indoleamine 2,3-dioxygenase